jgi:hypothetical protein
VQERMQYPLGKPLLAVIQYPPEKLHSALEVQESPIHLELVPLSNKDGSSGLSSGFSGGISPGVDGLGDW